MKTTGITEAFRQYGATLVNRMWAVSAVRDEEVVMSLWAHRFREEMTCYEDRLSRWKGNGNTLFRKHLALAYTEKRPIRVVVATSEDPQAVDRGEDASKIPKTFHTRPDLIGHVEMFDGDDHFRLRFTRA